MIHQYLEKLFDQYEWQYESSNGFYLLVVPLYCARSVALDEARKALDIFSERHVPLSVLELRIPTPQRRNTQMLYVARKNHKGVNHSEIPWRLVHWRIFLDRTTHANDNILGSKAVEFAPAEEGSNTEVEEILKSRAERELRRSKLPGEAFDSSNMQINTPLAPKRTIRDPWVESRRSVGVLALVGLFMLLAVTGSTLVWIDLLPTFWRVAGAIVALVVAVFAGRWVTGNRRTILPRLLACVVAIVLIAVVGVPVGQGISSNLKNSEVPFDLLTIAIALGAVTVGAFMIAGLFHSAVIYPLFRKFWSLPALTAIFAGAFALSPAALSASLAMAGSGNTLSDVPEWSHFVIALNIVSWGIGSWLFIFSLLGWMAYVGITTGTLFERILIYIMVGTLIPSLLVAASMNVLENGLRLISF